MKGLDPHDHAHVVNTVAMGLLYGACFADADDRSHLIATVRGCLLRREMDMKSPPTGRSPAETTALCEELADEAIALASRKGAA